MSSISAAQVEETPPQAQDLLALAVEAQRLTSEQAEALRSIEAALRDSEALGWFIEEHCREFRDWQSDGEQSLEWQEHYSEYVRLVEVRVEHRQSFLGVSGDELYALLAAVRGDQKADSFLTKLLAMGDYGHFCQMMRWLGRLEIRKYTTSL